MSGVRTPGTTGIYMAEFFRGCDLSDLYDRDIYQLFCLEAYDLDRDLSDLS